LKIKNKAILLNSHDWEELYINGKLVDEGHCLNEGEERAIYFAKLAEKYDFNLIKMKCSCLDDCDIKKTENDGNFPENINDFISNYEEDRY